MRRFSIAIVGALMALALMGAASVLAQDGGTAPSNLSATLRADDVLLKWTPGTDPEYIGQWIYYWENGKPDTKVGMLTTDTDRDNGNVPLSNFDTGSSYNFQISGAVRREREDGQQTIEASGHSNIVTVAIPEETTEQGNKEPSEPQPAPNAPPAGPTPTNLEATSSDGMVTLTWTPGQADDYVGQEIKRRVVRGKGWTTVTLGVSAGRYVDDSVEVGKKYIYRVKAVREDGTGKLSKPVRVVAR